MRRGPRPRLALSLALILSLPAAAEASVINGGFESGDFSGWQTVGNDVVTTSASGVAPTEGTHQALLNTNFGVASPASASQIEMFLDLPGGTLTSMAAIDGGAIKQTIAVAAHDVLSFSWDFATNEGVPGSNNADFAFVSITQLSVLADASSALVAYPQNPPFIFHTGYQSFSFAIPVSGDYLLGIGVVNAGISRGNSSGLLVDDVALAPVPEPPTVWLFLVGSLPLLARRRIFK